MSISRPVLIVVSVIVIILVAVGLWSISTGRTERHALDLTPPPNPNSGPRQDPYESNRKNLQAIQPQSTQ